MHSVQKRRRTQATGCSLAERLDDKVHALPTLSAVLMCQCLLPGNISDVKAAPALLEHAGRIFCRQGLMPTAFCAQCGMSIRFQLSPTVANAKRTIRQEKAPCRGQSPQHERQLTFRR